MVEVRDEMKALVLLTVFMDSLSISCVVFAVVVRTDHRAGGIEHEHADVQCHAQRREGDAGRSRAAGRRRS